MNDQPGVAVNGSCAPEFERVRDEFETNFRDRNEIGAAVAVWVDGDLAVDLWGGSPDAAGAKPWQHDTLASIFSGSKGVDEHVHSPARRSRRTRPGRPRRQVLARIRPGRKARHHRRDGDGPSLRGDRTAHPADTRQTPRLGRRLRRHRRGRTVVGARHRAGLSHGDLRLHPRRGRPPRHRPHPRPVPAQRNRRTPRHRRPHRPARAPNTTAAPRWSTSRTSATCWPPAAHPSTRPRSTEHPMAAFSVAIGFVPDDELGSQRHHGLAHSRIPRPPTPT